MGSISVVSIIIGLIGVAILSYGLVDIYLDDRVRTKMKNKEKDMKDKGINPRMRSGMVFNKKTSKLEEDISICSSHYHELSQSHDI
jgi:hypothetical protein